MKMSKKNILLGLALSLLSLGAFAQEKIKDVRTKPDLYFLQIDDVANSLYLLPPPPAPGSIIFLNDEAQYQWERCSAIPLVVHKPFTMHV